MAQRDIGCEDCGAVMPMQISSVSLNKPNVWHPGKKCPICGSEKFLPIIAITETDTRPDQPVSFKRRLLLNPWTGIAAIAVTIVVVLAVVFWPERRSDSGEKGLFICEKCGKLFFAKVASMPPVKCPGCGERAGYRAAACAKCSLVYSYHQHEVCPHCKEKLRNMLTTLEEAEKAKKAHKEYLKREEEMREDEDEYER